MRKAFWFALSVLALGALSGAVASAAEEGLQCAPSPPAAVAPMLVSATSNPGESGSGSGSTASLPPCHRCTLYNIWGQPIETCQFNNGFQCDPQDYRHCTPSEAASCPGYHPGSW